MNRNKNLLPLLTLLSALLLCFSACKKEKDEELSISVLSYNVAGLPEGISSSHPALYSSSISPLLNEYDLVHLQEDFCYHDSILLYNTHPFRTETLGCVPNGDGLNALSKYPISNVARFAWTNCTDPDCYTPKGFYYSQVSFMGEPVDVYNVHCNAGGSDASMQARRGNIAQLCTHIALHSAGKPVLIIGDFNSRYTREGDTIRALLEMGFKDVWVELIRSGAVPELAPDKLDDCEPVHTGANCERVDKFFYRSNSTLDITPLAYQVDDERFYYQGNDTLQLSDHWPVNVKYRLKKN
jgi:hypothetical protein